MKLTHAHPPSGQWTCLFLHQWRESSNRQTLTKSLNMPQHKYNPQNLVRRYNKIERGSTNNKVLMKHID
jgi:hypothetical protein